MEDGRVTLDPATLPSAETPLPVEHLSWRQGFSVAQTTVFGLPIDGELPGLSSIGELGIAVGRPELGDRGPLWSTTPTTCPRASPRS
ncbi:MAG: hypothetical protein GY913_05405 [Proteobacteria bacterium]|nr:hypothetical protein [Pseudomonadota bacterium]MCP4916339.1 hypothetical protein [Pseudomonadota bacterium]